MTTVGEDYHQYIIKLFEKWSKVYGIIVDFPLKHVRRKLVNLSEPTIDSSVLDVCTGTGEQAIAFAERTNSVVGIDLSKHMLNVAKGKHGSVDFIMADATALPFKDYSFEISCISLSLHDMLLHVRRRVLEEMKRVTRRKIVVADYYIPKNRYHRWLHVSLISLYESRYFRDFAKRDLKQLLGQHDLRVIKEACGLIDLIKVLLCKPSMRRTQPVAASHHSSHLAQVSER